MYQQSRDDGIFDHDEANVTIVSYLLQEASSARVVRVVSDDTDVFVLLVYWVWKADLVSTCKVQMERWDGRILDINKTCVNLGANCSQLLGIYAVSGCDIVSYPFRKEKIHALNVIMAGNFPGLSEVLGEEHTTDDDFLKLGHQYFAALYGQKPGTL